MGANRWRAGTSERIGAAQRLSLVCDEDGLSIEDKPLLRRVGVGFVPYPRAEVHRRVKQIYGCDCDIVELMGGLGKVARALNNGEIQAARATAAGLLMPRLDWAGTSRFFFRRSALSKFGFNPDEPRDWHGRWTMDGAGDMPAATDGALFAPEEGEAQLSSDGRFEGSMANSGAGASVRYAPYSLPDGDQRGVDSEAENSLLNWNSDLQETFGHDYNIDGEIAGDDLEDVAYNGVFHDEIRDSILDFLKSKGLVAEKEVSFLLNGTTYLSRADLVAMKAGDPSTLVVIEIKTGPGSRLEESQKWVYPGLVHGGIVSGVDGKISSFGYVPGQILPPVPVMIWYEASPEAPPDITFVDPVFPYEWRPPLRRWFPKLSPSYSEQAWSV